MQTRSLLLLVLGLTGAPICSRAAAQAPAAAPTSAPAPQQVQSEPAPMAQPSLAPAVQPAAPPLLVQPGPPLWAQPGPGPRPPGRYGPPPSERSRLPPPRLHPIEPHRPGKAGAPFALGVGGSLLFRSDHAHDVLSDRRSTGAFDLFATYDVWSPFRGAIVALGASLRSEARVGNDDYDLHSNAIQAEAMARYGATQWLWPHVRLAVGGVTTRFQQHDRLANIDFEDHSGSAVGTFGAGFTLRTPTRMLETERGWLASLSLGLLVEGGYTVAKDATLDLRPTHPGEVTRATFSLGGVERSAPYLRIMGVLRI